MVKTKWLLCFTLCLSFYSTSAETNELILHIVDDMGEPACSAEPLDIQIGNQFRIRVEPGDKDLYTVGRCNESLESNKSSNTEFKKDTKGSGYISKELSATQPGSSVYECILYTHKCESITDSGNCHYKDAKKNYRTDEGVKCFTKVYVRRKDETVVKPSGFLTVNGANVTSGEYKFNTGEGVNFTCHKTTGSQVKLSLDTVLNGKQISTDFQQKTSVSIYKQLKNICNDAILTCNITAQHGGEQVVTLRLTVSQEKQAKLNFVINGSTLPRIKQTENEYHYEYRYYHGENVTVNIDADEKVYWKIKCNATGPEKIKSYLNGAYMPMDDISFTINKNDTGATLLCTALKRDTEINYLKVLKLTFIFHTLDYSPYIKGLPMSNILLQYSNSSSNMVEYETRRNELFHFLCVTRELLKNPTTMRIDGGDVIAPTDTKASPGPFKIPPDKSEVTIKCQANSSDEKVTYLKLIVNNNPVTTTTVATTMPFSTTTLVTTTTTFATTTPLPTTAPPTTRGITNTTTTSLSPPVSPSARLTTPAPLNTTTSLSAITPRPTQGINNITTLPPPTRGTTNSTTAPLSRGTTNATTPTVPIIRSTPSATPEKITTISTSTATPNVPLNRKGKAYTTRKTSPKPNRTRTIPAKTTPRAKPGPKKQPSPNKKVNKTKAALTTTKRKSASSPAGLKPTSASTTNIPKIEHTTPAPAANLSTSAGSLEKNLIEQNSSLVWVIVVALALIVFVVAFVLWISFRKKKRILKNSTLNMEYMNLPEHHEGPMATPPQWDRPDNSYDSPNSTDNLYANTMPTQRTKLEPTYADPRDSIMQHTYINNQQINNEPTYASVQQNEPAYASVQNNEPTYASVQQNEPAYASVQKSEPAYASVQKSEPAYASVHKAGKASHQPDPTYANQSLLESQKASTLKKEDAYAEVTKKTLDRKNKQSGKGSKSHFKNQGERSNDVIYADLCSELSGNKKYVNANVKNDVEPAYCEIMKKK